MTIDTSPSGASIVVTKSDGTSVASGTAPLQVQLDSGSGYFGSAGYLITATNANGTSNLTLSSKLNGWYFGNILFGVFGLIGFVVVDPLTGAMYRFDDRLVIAAPVGKTSQGSFDYSDVPMLALGDVPQELHGNLVPISD